jgi:hypothetical protein
VKRKIMVLAIVFTVAVEIVSGTSYGQNCKLDGFTTARTDGEWSLINGSFFSNLRPKLTNPAFFDAVNGAVPFGITILPGQSTVSLATLTFPNSTVFATGWTATSTYSAAERSAILAYVMSGGNFLGTFDDTSHSIADLFGITQPNIQGPANQNILARANVLFDGPFGRVESLIAAGAVGQFSFVPGNGEAVANSSVSAPPPQRDASIVVFERGALGPNSGRVVITNDTNYGSTAEGGGDDTVFMLNTLAFLCGVPNIPGGNTRYFPQIALNGGYSIESPLSNSSLTNTMTVMYDLFDDNGVDFSANSTTLGPSSTQVYSTGGLFSSPVKTGWARVRSTSNDAVFSSVKFLLTDITGAPVTTVGVGQSSPGRNFTLSGTISPTETVGIALLALPTNGGTATITIKALNSSGVQFGNTLIMTLNPGAHTAAFIDQLIGVSRATSTVMSVSISSDQQIAILGLSSNDPGGKLGSIPVFNGRN